MCERGQRDGNSVRDAWAAVNEPKRMKSPASMGRGPDLERSFVGSTHGKPSSNQEG